MALMDITAWSALSAYGLDRTAFAAGARDRRPPEPQRGRPGEHACPVPAFEPRAVLGRKGTRDMDRVTALAVAAVGQLLAEDGAGGDDPTRPSGRDIPGTALVLGTTTGSVQSMTDFTRSSLTGERPFDVDPGVIPNSVMNCAAAQCAIRHGLKGPNTTLANGRTSAFFGLSYARRLLRAERTRSVLCGGVEEYSEARAWLDARSRDGVAALLGEGAAMMRLTPAGEAGGAIASVLAVRTGLAADHADLADHDAGAADAEAAVHVVVTEALAQAGITADSVWAAVPSGLVDGETRALDALFPRQAREVLPAPGELLGDTGAASSALQLAWVLAEAGRAPGGHAVITSVGEEGLVAAVVLRMGEGPR